MLRDEILAIISGLTFPSEADFPVEFFESTSLPKGTTFAFESFMDDLATNEPRFAQLKRYLLDRTTDQTVIHAGDRYYMIGLAFSKWIGVQAQAVET